MRERKIKNAVAFDVTQQLSWHVERHREGIALLTHTSFAAGGGPIELYFQQRSFPALAIDAWGQFFDFDDPAAEKTKIINSYFTTDALLDQLQMSLKDASQQEKTSSLPAPQKKQLLDEESIALANSFAQLDKKEVQLWWSLLVSAVAEKVFEVGVEEQNRVRMGEKEFLRKVKILNIFSCASLELSSEIPQTLPDKQCAQIQISLREWERKKQSSLERVGECDATILTRIENLRPLQMIFKCIVDDNKPESILMKRAQHMKALLNQKTTGEQHQKTNALKFNSIKVLEHWTFHEKEFTAVALPVEKASTN